MQAKSLAKEKGKEKGKAKGKTIMNAPVPAPFTARARPTRATAIATVLRRGRRGRRASGAVAPKVEARATHGVRTPADATVGPGAGPTGRLARPSTPAATLRLAGAPEAARAASRTTQAHPAGTRLSLEGGPAGAPLSREGSPVAGGP